MAVILGTRLVDTPNVIVAAQELSISFETGELPNEPEIIYDVLAVLNSREHGANINGAKDIFVHASEGYAIPDDSIDIEFMPEGVMTDLMIPGSWFMGHLHSIEWVKLDRFASLGARMFDVINIADEAVEPLDTVFFPVMAIRSVFAQK